MKQWTENLAMANQGSSSGGTSELVAWKRENAESRKEVANLRSTSQSAPEQQQRPSLKGNNGVSRVQANHWPSKTQRTQGEESHSQRNRHNSFTV